MNTGLTKVEKRIFEALSKGETINLRTFAWGEAIRDRLTDGEGKALVRLMNKGYVVFSNDHAWLVGSTLKVTAPDGRTIRVTSFRDPFARARATLAANNMAYMAATQQQEPKPDCRVWSMLDAELMQPDMTVLIDHAEKRVYLVKRNGATVQFAPGAWRGLRTWGEQYEEALRWAETRNGSDDFIVTVEDGYTTDRQYVIVERCN